MMPCPHDPSVMHPEPDTCSACRPSDTLRTATKAALLLDLITKADHDAALAWLDDRERLALAFLESTND